MRWRTYVGRRCQGRTMSLYQAPSRGPGRTPSASPAATYDTCAHMPTAARQAATAVQVCLARSLKPSLNMLLYNGPNTPLEVDRCSPCGAQQGQVHSQQQQGTTAAQQEHIIYLLARLSMSVTTAWRMHIHMCMMQTGPMAYALQQH